MPEDRTSKQSGTQAPKTGSDTLEDLPPMNADSKDIKGGMNKSELVDSLADKTGITK